MDPTEDATNLEEKAISLIGWSLYEAFIRELPAKQWQTDPTQAQTRTSSPGCQVVTMFDNPLVQRQTHEACPPTATPGWSGWPTIPNIEVRLETRPFDVVDEFKSKVRSSTPVRSTSTSAM